MAQPFDGVDVSSIEFVNCRLEIDGLSKELPDGTLLVSEENGSRFIYPTDLDYEDMAKKHRIKFSEQTPD